ncbi:hypothetical protein BS47DRAFT_1315749, partial [Hydnum rufescens UP504]
MPVTIAALEDALRSSLTILHLVIEDTSSGCGENYSVIIVSDDFEGKTTLATAQDLVLNEVLKDQIAAIHAFSQKTLTSKQYEAQRAKEC